MINKLIQKELEKLQDAKIDSYDELKHTYHITLRNKQTNLELKHTYILEISDSLLNPSSDNLLVSNWNQGRHPTQKYVKGYVAKNLAQMFYIYCMYYNIEEDKELDEDYEGWFSLDSIKVVREVL